MTSNAPAIEHAVRAALTTVAPPVPTPDIVEHRVRVHAYEVELWAQVGLDAPALRTEEHVIATPGHPDAVLRLLYPDKAGPLPICLSLFGGAFRQGGLHHPGFIVPAARRAARAGVIMACLSYALAPEHPYPTAVEQCGAALDWIVANAAEIGADPARIAVDGASAGGNLAAALTLLNRDRNRHPIRTQILEVPLLDLTGAHLDWAAVPAEFRAMAEADLASVLDGYIPEGARKERYASPLLAELDGLPPALVLTAEVDPLRGDGEAYAAALDAAGVAVTAMRVIGADHGSMLYEKVSAGARTAQQVVVDALLALHDD